MGAKKKKEPAYVHSCGIAYLFIQGYCQSAITFGGYYEENPRALKHYMLNLQVNTPTLLAASIKRPNRDETMS